MRLLGALLTVAVVVLLGASGTGAAGETNAEKILGKWEATKGDNIPAGSIIEFMKGGKIKATIKADGKEISLDATYKIDGKKIIVKHKVGDKEETDTSTIKTLDEKMLSILDKEGKLNEFKRVEKK